MPDDRHGKPPAPDQPGRFRRGVSALAVRGVSGFGRRGSYLLQPGNHQQDGDPADHRGDGPLHGRGRLHPGDERRGGPCKGDRGDLSRRSSPGAGRHGRGGDGGRIGGRRSPLPRQRRFRLLGRRRRPRHPDHQGHRPGAPRSGQIPRSPPAPPAPRSTIRGNSTGSSPAA